MKITRIIGVAEDLAAERLDLVDEEFLQIVAKKSIELGYLKNRYGLPATSLSSLFSEKEKRRLLSVRIQESFTDSALECLTVDAANKGRSKLSFVVFWLFLGASIISVAWAIFVPDFEPIIVALTSIAVTIGTYQQGKMPNKNSQADA